MKNYIKIFVACTLLVVIGSCSESFLEEKVRDQYKPSQLNDVNGFNAAIIGLHYQLMTHHSTTDDQSVVAVWHAGTDIVWSRSDKVNPSAKPYYDYSQLKSEDLISRRVWRWLYKLVSNANIIIANAEKEIPGLSQEDKDAFSAEAKFFRAYAYHMLATLYGDVPLVTEPITSSKTDFVRTPVSEVDKVIVSDLLFAVAHLPKIGEAVSDSRANKAMARQLLAEAYLRTGNNAGAEAQLDSVINGSSGALSLIRSRYGVNAGKPGDAFADMFVFGNQRRSQGNTEAIWVTEVENKLDVPGGNMDNPQQRRLWVSGYYDLKGMLPCDSLGGRGIGRVRLNNWVIYDLYEANDMRNSNYNLRRQLYFNNPEPLYKTIYGLQVPYGVEKEFTLADGSKFKVVPSDTTWRIAPYSTKWGHYDPDDNFGYGMWKDFIFMRLAETYLLRAEARLNQNDLDGAAEDLNVIRERANVSPIEAQDVTLDFILDERARELIGEENRRMTLVRTKTLKERAERLNSETDEHRDVGFLAVKNMKEDHLLMPIPQTEIDLNKDAELKQNTGY